MPDFRTINYRCLDSCHILISCQFKLRYPLNFSCSKIFDSCKIKRMVTNITQLVCVNNYDKNRYLEFFSKAAVSLWELKVAVATRVLIRLEQETHLFVPPAYRCYI